MKKVYALTFVSFMVINLSGCDWLANKVASKSIQELENKISNLEEVNSELQDKILELEKQIEFAKSERNEEMQQNIKSMFERIKK